MKGHTYLKYANNNRGPLFAFDAVTNEDNFNCKLNYFSFIYVDLSGKNSTKLMLSPGFKLGLLTWQACMLPSYYRIFA